MIGQTLGHYRIVEKIGAGGMGVVYRAHDERLDRDVALKVLPAGTLADEATRKRFHKEALALAKLNHPNIGTLYDFDTQEGVDFLVMEYIPGLTLDQKLAAGPLPEKEIGRLAIQLAEGLGAAHEQGVVHRDLKPGNLRVLPDGRLKILDFGLAKLLRPSADRVFSQGTATTETIAETQIVAGTVPYMAPEQLQGEPADARSDIYAAGAVLYEMATGQRPFSESHGARLIDAILHQAPAAPSAVHRRISPELESLILKALDKDPERRYQSARELRVDFERLSAPVPLVSAPGPREASWRRVWPRTKSRRWTLGLSAATILSALVVILWVAGTRPALSFAPRDWVLVTDFDNQTADPLFDKALFTAFTVSLEQSTHANVFPRTRMDAALRRMAKTTPVKIDEALGREICLRANIRGLISCTVAKIGREYALSARLIDPQTGDTVRSYLERAKDQDQILGALGKIAAMVRRDLGESLLSVRRSDRPLPQVTTASLQALKLYADGRELWGKGKWSEGVKLYEAALQHDPHFAIVHAALGSAYNSHIFNNPVLAKEHFEKALQRPERITERERLYIQATYKHDLGHLDEAIQLYDLYLKAYPDDSDTRYNFGNLLMRNERPQEAIEQYKEVIRVAPNNANAYINLATCYSELGKHPEALAHYGKAFELEPTWITLGNLNHEYGFALVASGDIAKAREVFSLALAKPDIKARALRSLALLELYQGKYRDAKARLREAILLNQAAKYLLPEARNHLYMAIVLDGLGEQALCLRELDRGAQALKTLPPQAWLAALLGSAYARSGGVAGAARMLDVVRKQSDLKNPKESSDLHLLEGEMELARGNRARAIELLLLADREMHSPLTVEALAHAYQTAGDTGQAIAWYETLMGMGHRFLGWEPQQLWLAAHYHLARAYLSRGEKDKAAKILDTLLNLWKEADTDLPLLHKAAQLQKELHRQEPASRSHG